MKNNSLERERGYLDGYIYDIRTFIDDLIREVEDLEYDIDRANERISELENQLIELAE